MKTFHHRLELSKAGNQSLGEVMMAGHLSKKSNMMPSYRYLGAHAIVLLLSGSGTYLDDIGRFAVVRPGSIICINPEVGHKYGPAEGESWEELYLVFSGPVFDLMREKKLWGEHVWMLQVDDAELLRAKLTNILTEYGDKPLLLVTHLQLCLLELLHSQPELSLVIKSQPALSKSLALLANTDYTVSHIASEVGMGFENFRKKFKEEFSISPHQYRQKQIYQKAWHLLLGSDASIQAVAQQLGFEDEHYFSRFFKKHNGLSPAHFRASLTSANQ